jgi:chromosome segregation ATPase
MKKAMKRAAAGTEGAGVLMETVVRLRDSFDTRLSTLSERIGEVKARADAQEMTLAKLQGVSKEATELVRETRPQVLLADLKRREIEIEELKGRLRVDEELLSSLAKDLKEVRRVISEFKGIEELAKLSEEAKEDLKLLRELKTDTEAHADKIESIFVEIHRRVGELRGLKSKVEDMGKTMREITKRLNRLEVSVRVRKE